MGFHKNIQLAGTVTVGPKGQVVIPSEIRDAMVIEPGDKLVALYLPDKKSLGFITEDQAQEFIDMMGKKYALPKNMSGKIVDTKPEGWD